MNTTQRSIEKATHAIERVNAAAAKVERLREQLWKAEQVLRGAQSKAWDALPDGHSIHLGETWELR